ncbi:helix-turn-helix domain-containing protein [Parabacteroides sp. OttesenSCG-928-K15]|nr:helix-turn-helix domain-containing protein [Parabacteroides sp. OttesenSCG-928-K15]
MESSLFSWENPSSYGPIESEQSLIEKVIKKQGEEWHVNIYGYDLIFLIDGELILSYDRFIEREIPNEEFLLISPGSHLLARAKQDVFLLVFHLSDSVFLRKLLSSDIQSDNLETSTQGVNSDILPVGAHVKRYLSSLLQSISSYSYCNSYYQIKINELYYLLFKHYSMEELIVFFHPILNPNLSFKDFVLTNYHKATNIQELASLCSYSLSGFEKKFRRVFGMSAYQWMKERKNNQIYHEIHLTDKPFKQIADEQGFLSMPQFSDYCKKHFGLPPGKLRKRINHQE